ncbi:MAG: PKD domain-containing protein, partial [Crocinitomicaceae bacterium]|nr:PKD domain-containing protein [Crocinitomicaceae bacterium]
NDYEFNYEILIPDLEAYYVDMLTNPQPTVTQKNATCSSTSGGSTGFSPATPSNFNLGTMGGYLKYAEMLAELDAMAQQYPTLITTKAPISSFVTAGNRPIYHVKISDNPNTNESEPKILYTAIHHAREPMSLMETIFFMWYVLENYGTNDEVTYLVNNTQLYFVPCINPDGYVYNETTNATGGGMWRKNRRLNSGGSYGVDLNRNYSYGWGTTGTSATQSNDTYRGTAAFSEPETQAMRWLVQNHNFISAFNAHTYAEDILFPIGTTTAEFAEHHDYFQDYTNHMVQYNGYTAMKSSGLYPASGDSDDYMYKVDVGVGQKDTIFAHTPEVGTAFWQPQAEIIPTCAEMVFPNLVLAHIARNYNVVNDTDPSAVATLSGNFNHSIKRLGREAGPVTVSIQPLLNIATVGNSVVYNLNSQQSSTGAISYTLNPNIQFGDQIKYILKTDNGLWVKKDTIIKTYGSVTLQVLEDATASTNWTGTWGTTTSTYVSATKSFADSPTGNYASNTNKTYTYVPTIDLTNATSAKISFYAKWNLEADYDYTQFQVSIDNGANWIGQCGNYTVLGTSANGSVQPNNQPVYEGVQSTWVLEEINLSDYLGQQIKVRFQLKSDGGTNADGFYFDDFKIFYNEGNTTIAPVASFQPSSANTCLGNSISFSDFSSNVPTIWAWDFGDGSTSNQQNPSHTYLAAGSFTVSLTVTNSAGTNSITNSIVVNANPTVTLTSNDADNVICNNQGIVQLTTNPSSAIISGNGVSGSTFDPSIANIGINVITANYTDANGCSAQSPLNLIVENCAGLNENSAQNLQVFPNPTEGIVTLKNALVDSEFLIFDFKGQLVKTGKVNSENQVVSLENIASGVYTIQINEMRVKLVVKK